MKQKRKVKSLLPQKKCGWQSFLTILLLVLWLILCLWSASLMTTMAAWASSEWDNKLSYSWVNDNVEVLYNLDFVKPENLQSKVASMFTDKNKDFKLKSLYSLIVNPDGNKSNEIATWVRSNILWWKDNIILSGDNITIIGWESNMVEDYENSDNSVMFWWQGNDLKGGKDGWSPAIMVWWSNNQIELGHDWVVVIGWNNQQVNEEGAENVILIGWRWVNVGRNVKNVIVAWWKNVTINNWLENIFVFSNSSSFVPQTSGTFYLDVLNWLWINTSISKMWVAVNGPVKVWEVNINTKTCGPDNYWVIGIWNAGEYACTVACTPRSSRASKWDLLDQWSGCVAKCKDNSSNCFMASYIWETDDSFEGVCTTWVDVTNAWACTPDVWEQYNNVFFETALIDAKDAWVTCPSSPQNKCIFQCNTGFHLTWDLTKSSQILGTRAWTTGCFSDCFFQWRDKEWVSQYKHNETVYWYNTETVYCSHDRYLSYGDKSSWIDGGWSNLGRDLSSWLNITNNNGWTQRPWKAGHDVNKLYYLDDGYGLRKQIWTLYWTERVLWWNGKTPVFREDYTNYRYLLPEHCGNNAHKVLLVCVDWTMYLAKEDGQTPTQYLAGEPGKLWTYAGAVRSSTINLGYAHSWYVFSSCKLEWQIDNYGNVTHDYKCDAWQYNLTRSNIINNLAEPATGLDNQKVDRFEMKWQRGMYRLCVDYKVETEKGGDRKYNMHNPGNEECVVDYQSMNNSDKTKPYYEGHYQFLWCNKWYFRSVRPEDLVNEAADGSYYVCRKACDIDVIDNNSHKTETVRDQASIILFKSPEETCEGGELCEWHTFTCDDWKLSDESLLSTYKYTKCKQKWNSCAGYNADTDTHEHSEYVGPCQWIYAYDTQTEKEYKWWYSINYNKWWDNWKGTSSTWKARWDENLKTISSFPVQSCTWWEIKYKLTDCDDCYHDNENRGEYCVKDFKKESCSVGSYYNAVAGQIEYEWNWQKVGWWSYTKTDGCRRYCEEGYYWNGSRCYSNPDESDMYYNSYGYDSSYSYYSYDNRVLESETDLFEVETESFEDDDNHMWWTHYMWLYISWDNNGHSSGDTVETYRFDSCYNGYYQVWYSCVSIPEDDYCRWKLPIHAIFYGFGDILDTNGYTDYESKGHDYTLDVYGTHDLVCWFECDEDNGYIWDDELWMCVREHCNNSKWYIRYDGSGWVIRDENWNGWSQTFKQDVIRGEQVRLPNVTRVGLKPDCYDFLWWYDKNGNKPSGTNGMPWEWYRPTRNITLYAKWQRKDTEACQYVCEWETPTWDPEEALRDKNDKPTVDGLEWTPITNQNAVLQPCQYRCNVWYEVGSGNVCKEKECKSSKTDVKYKAPWAHTISGKNTYVWTDNRYWNYNTSLNACQWSCEEGYDPVYVGGVRQNECGDRVCKGILPTWDHVLTWLSTYTGADRSWTPVTWTTDLKPCEWTCDSGFVVNGNKCDAIVNGQCTSEKWQKKSAEKKCFTWTLEDVADSESKDFWNCKSPNWWEREDGCFMCKTWWTWDNCELKIKDGKCSGEKYGCNPWSAINTGDTLPNKYTWDCQWEYGWATGLNCFVCKENWTGTDCATEIIIPVKWKCASWHFGCISWNLMEGTANTWTDSWTWVCEGLNAGGDDNCSESLPSYIVRFTPNKLQWDVKDQTIRMYNKVNLYKNTFSKQWYIFDHWNTKADDSWIRYNDEQPVENLTSTPGDVVVLYAISKCDSWYIDNGAWNCVSKVNWWCGSTFKTCSWWTMTWAMQVWPAGDWNSGTKWWRWSCEWNVWTQECSAIWSCDWSSSVPRCEGDSTCDNSQKPTKGCAISKSCWTPAPGSNTTGWKAIYIGDSSVNKTWTFKTNISNLGECEWWCVSDAYERENETSMNCKLKVTWCEWPCGSAAIWSPLTCYHTWSVDCASTDSYCASQTRTCQADGTWDSDFTSTYTSATCSLKSHGCYDATDDWKSCVAKTYEVEYSCGDGSGNPWSQRVVYWTTPDLYGEECTKTNYKQTWWKKSGSSTVYWLSTPMAGDLISGCEKITLEAVYDENNKFTVTFDSQGWTSVDPQSVYSGETVTEPSDPIRTCYTLDYWYKSGALAAYSWATPVTSSFTLKAKWLWNEYNIMYSCNGWDATKSSMTQTVTYGITSKLRTDGCMKSWYTLMWWGSDSSSAPSIEWSLWGDMTDRLINQCSEQTVYARWKEVPMCTITFDSKWWTSVSSQTIPCGEKWSEPSDPTKNCYNFDAWYKSGATTSYNWDDSVTSSFTLHAEWKTGSYIINYSCNGWQWNPSDQIGTYWEYIDTHTDWCSKDNSILLWWSTNQYATWVEYQLWDEIDGDLADCGEHWLYAIYAECVAWTKVWNTCQIKLNCWDNYVQVGNVCVPYGSCYDREGGRIVAPFSNLYQDKEDVLPIWTTWVWFCKDNASDVINNSCQFSCGNWFKCYDDHTYGCTQDKPEKYCTTDTYAATWYKEYDWWEVWRLPTEANQAYDEVSQHRMSEIVNNKTQWCYLACKSGYIRDGTWKCSKTEYCKYADFTSAKYSPNVIKCSTGMERTNVWKDEFESALANWDQCIWACTFGNAIPVHLNKEYAFYSKFEYPSHQEYYWCWRQCDEDKYTNMFAQCLSPDLWYRVNTGQTLTFKDITNYVGQLPIDCSPGVFNSTTKSCLVTQTQDCSSLGPKWVLYESNCVACLLPHQHFSTSVWKCVND